MPRPRLGQSVGGGLPRWVYRALSPKITALDDFRGGLNLRDYPFVAPNELIQAFNVEINRSGAGITNAAIFNGHPGGAPPGGGTLTFATYSKALDTIVCFVSGGTVPGWYRTTDFVAYTLINLSGAGGPSTALDKASAVDFGGELVVSTTGDGIFALSAAFAWTLCTAAVKPKALAVWQNKVWAIGDTTQKTRVWASNAGNSHIFTTATDWVDIREPSDDPCIAIVATQSQDYQGRPSLLVYKARSVHRINSANATTGFSFTTLSVGIGCRSRFGALAVLGSVLSIDDNGIWATDGLAIPQKVSGKIEPIFTALKVNLGGSDDSGSFAFQHDGRAYWHVPTTVGGLMPNQLICYDATIGAWSLVRENIATPTFTYVSVGYVEANFSTSARVCYFVRYGVAEVPFKMFDTLGPSFGQARVQTAWLEFAQGGRFVARRARMWLRIRENLTVTLYTNFSQVAVNTYTITGDGATPLVRPRDIWSLGKPRAISLQFDYNPSNGPQGAILDPNPSFGTPTVAWIPAFLLSRIFFKTTSTSAE